MKIWRIGILVFFMVLLTCCTINAKQLTLTFIDVINLLISNTNSNLNINEKRLTLNMNNYKVSNLSDLSLSLSRDLNTGANSANFNVSYSIFDGHKYLQRKENSILLKSYKEDLIINQKECIRNVLELYMLSYCYSKNLENLQKAKEIINTIYQNISVTLDEREIREFQETTIPTLDLAIVQAKQNYEKVLNQLKKEIGVDEETVLFFSENFVVQLEDAITINIENIKKGIDKDSYFIKEYNQYIIDKINNDTHDIKKNAKVYLNFNSVNSFNILENTALEIRTCFGNDYFQMIPKYSISSKEQKISLDILWLSSKRTQSTINVEELKRNRLEDYINLINEIELVKLNAEIVGKMIYYKKDMNIASNYDDLIQNFKWLKESVSLQNDYNFGLYEYNSKIIKLILETGDTKDFIDLLQLKVK